MAVGQAENQLEQYYGFYTNRPFWAISKPDFTNTEVVRQFTQVISEIVAEYEDKYYKLRFCRDGLVLFHSKFENLNIKNILEYLNALSIIIESETQNWTLKQMFHINEINKANVIPHTYSGIELKGFNTAGLDFTTQYDYNIRFLHSYIPLEHSKVDYNTQFWPNLIKHSIFFDVRIRSRENRILGKDLLDNINSNFARVAKNYNSISLLAQITKSIEQFENGHYDIALILSWFIIETYLYKLYNSKVLKNINPTDEDLSAAELLKILQQRRVLSYSLVGEIHKIRILRNKIVHNTFESEVSPQDTLLSFEIIKEFIKQDIGLTLNLKF